MADPIIVKDTVVPGIIATATRYALTAIGGWVIAKGYFSAEDWPQISGAILAAIPAAWGIYASFKNKKKLIKTADAAPNSVAVVK